TQRIVRLIERGVPARNILAVTFTNKAAAEMAERVHSLGKATKNASVKEATISTFHSFGLSVLTKEKSARGGAFTIFDQGDCLGAIKELMR
ncbi:UvrD-helicase domain-containing protein, partial [Acinetobacter baumannii]